MARQSPRSLAHRRWEESRQDPRPKRPRTRRQPTVPKSGEVVPVKGKQATASTNRRLRDAQIRVQELERALKQERSAHAVTARVAERVEAMEHANRVLRMELELATGDEVRRLNEMVASLRVQLEEKDGWVRDIKEKWERILGRVTPLLGKTAIQGFEELIKEIDGKTVIVANVPRGARKHMTADRAEALDRARRIRQ